MHVKRLDHLNLTVENFEQTVRWYEELFGFEVVEKGSMEGLPWGVIRSNHALLCIYEHPGQPKPRRRDDPRHGLSHFALTIDDPDAWEARARSTGTNVLYGGVVHWPHSRSWYVLDPTGYEIEVVHWKSAIAFG